MGIDESMNALRKEIKRVNEIKQGDEIGTQEFRQAVLDYILADYGYKLGELASQNPDEFAEAMKESVENKEEGNKE
jgi:hypothetical protein